MKKQVEALTPFDEKKALARVRVIEQEVDLVVRTIGEEPLELEDQDDFKVASAELIKVIMKRDEVEENLKLFMDDVQKLVDRVNGWFAKPRGDVARAEAYFRNAITKFAKRLGDEAHAMREKAAGIKNETKAAELLTAANEHKPVKVPGISILPQVKYVITDLQKVPKQYFKLVLDKKALEADVEQGKPITGVTPSIEYGLRVTPKNAKLGEA